MRKGILYAGILYVLAVFVRDIKVEGNRKF